MVLFLLKIVSRFLQSFSENINVIPLPSSANANNDYLNDPALASGWGKPTDSAESISDVLREVTLPVGDNSVCNWYYLGVIQDTHLCADGADGKSTCSGDSGGPLRASTGELVRKFGGTVVGL